MARPLPLVTLDLGDKPRTSAGRGENQEPQTQPVARIATIPTSRYQTGFPSSHRPALGELMRSPTGAAADTPPSACRRLGRVRLCRSTFPAARRTDNGKTVAHSGDGEPLAQSGMPNRSTKGVSRPHATTPSAILYRQRNRERLYYNHACLGTVVVNIRDRMPKIGPRSRPDKLEIVDGRLAEGQIDGPRTR